MSKETQSTTMDKLRSVILGTDGRGSLYRWLRRHHDELQEMLEQVSRPDWKAITDALSDEHLLDATGKTPTPERVRQTWVKVRSDVQKTRDKSVKRQVSQTAVSNYVQAPSKPQARTGAKEDGKEPLAAFRERMKKNL